MQQNNPEETNAPDWIEIRFPIDSVPDELLETVEETLTEYCGGSETLEENNNEIIRGYLPAIDSGRADLTRLMQEFDEIARRNGLESNLISGKVVTRTIRNTDWAANWKQYYKPERIGNNFIVYPSWEKPEDLQSDDILIQLDPGQAFGTGQHESTQLCLCILEELDINNWHIADVGCGSGILSIAAALGGAKDVYGADIDGVAVETATENSRRNGVASQLQFRTGSTDALRNAAPYDLVFANIISQVLMDIGAELRSLAKPGGLLIWSGILYEEARELEEYIDSLGMIIEERKRDGKWVGYLLKAQC
ncbi:MAG: 50S ribosomal protein L11 methyltransferase [Candidatus Marinimicrobia bacterium]|nr:50S ribosomal protein L11 methyltransferase [Candidatus Neomarinimicrobiota bacterium]MCF7827967.1 50S ribosomal protein L11 methyltransferase [Candidatus Neomarinimicrobiota bacterium]MCF7879278.1 50S ribosomal protein L11 methyltransferase [Candidatus Neomarinimicrobiota bacterium]